MARDGKPSTRDPALRFLDGGGETGRAIAARDWTDTRLGPARDWSAGLKVALANILVRPQPMFVCWGKDLNFFFNDAYAPVLGERLEGALGRPAHVLWADIWTDMEPLASQAMQGVSCKLEAHPITLMTSSGPRESWWSFIYSPAHEPTGEIGGFIATVTETAGQVISRRRAAASRERRLALLRQMPGFVALLKGPELTYEYANDAYVKAAGGRELIGLTSRQAFPELKGHDRIDTVYATGEPFVMRELPIRLKGETEDRYIDQLFAPIRDETGAVDGVFVGGYDLTDRVRAERELAKLNATLEHEVEKRTAELMEAEAALRQAQKMEAVGQLTGGIAHDFNNMLAVVIGSLELLDRRVGGQDARTRRYIDAASASANRAAQLIQHLLAFARRQPLQPEILDVNDLVEGMSTLLAHSIGADIRLTTELADDLWPTRVDPNQLESVILNLAVNSRDAMPEGGRMTIRTENSRLERQRRSDHPGPPNGDYVMIAVSDSGSGMTPETVGKAFEPFFTTKAVGRGTGLGLSQVYGFISQSGGEVQIESEVGAGTTVKVLLPRFAGARAERSTAGKNALQRASNQEVVLVVEDEGAVRQVSVEALSELGYEVLQADGGAAALKLLEERPDITLLFTDVIMPDMNGRRLADAALKARPDLKVLFTTGYASGAVVHDGVVEPGVHMIGKPFSLERLAAKIRAVLDD